ncbi:20974_t:CDS:10 [Dentiscutata erythropus]|uniref:Protein PNS1 n=1 Tax=Dentiscutata erythropus TaxID=1348616 RepID=A0A9N8WF93_9GLOM|nr:20974_t:CDS:10 [Dentiscutata erythropus]
MSQQHYPMPDLINYAPPPTSPNSTHPYTHTSQGNYYMPDPIYYAPPPTSSNSIHPYTHTSPGKTSTYYNDNERPPSYEPQNTSYVPPQSGYQPPPSFEQATNSGSDDTDVRFNTRPKPQDLWAIVLFLLDFLAFIIVSAISLRNYEIIQRQSRTPVESVTLNWSTILLLAFCVGIGFVLSTGYLILAHKWKPMIPFSSIMLQTITSIMNRYKAMVLAAFVGLIVYVLYTIWWIFTFIAAYQVWYPAACMQTQRTQANCQTGPFTAIVIFLLFTYYWVSQVIQTFIHVTTSGVFASYYFLEGTPQGVPPSPTLNSAKRAATTSFGSICFGSLLVAILQVIRQLLRSLAQGTDNPLGAFFAACAAALVGYIDSLLEYFNFYAYTQVAIYGKSFCDAAKDTWTMIKDRGVEAIINDNLIGTVIMMGSFLVGMITALFGYLYTIIFHPSFNAGGGFTPLLVFLAFIIGFQMLSIIGSVIFSGAATTFVCLAENPDALARTKPDLYNEIIRTYPAFAQGIRA